MLANVKREWWVSRQTRHTMQEVSKALEYWYKQLIILADDNDTAQGDVENACEQIISFVGEIQQAIRQDERLEAQRLYEADDS